jgi:hypothetical protein
LFDPVLFEWQIVPFNVVLMASDGSSFSAKISLPELVKI